MAAIDKIYVNSWDEYIQFKKWCEEQPPLFDKYDKIVRLTDYLYQYEEKWEGCHPVFNAPYYIDAYVIRNCPFDFIQKGLMLNYGHWSQERIKSFYEDVKNWSDGDCPYWAKLEDFITLEDGTMTIKGLGESSYSEIKRGLLYNSPLTGYHYTVGKHFKCIKRPAYLYNTPYKCKQWFINITPPDELPYMMYHKNHNSWDFIDEFVESNWSSSTAYVKTIKALKRLMIKWKLPVGAIVRAIGGLVCEEYEFVITKQVVLDKLNNMEIDFKQYECFVAECYEAEDEFWKGIYEDIETERIINEIKENFENY